MELNAASEGAKHSIPRARVQTKTRMMLHSQGFKPDWLTLLGELKKKKQAHSDWRVDPWLGPISIHKAEQPHTLNGKSEQVPTPKWR